jgi:ethanolamine ammonia-lyase small subunit
VWSYDFVFDHCANGQQLKCLTITDHPLGTHARLSAADQIEQIGNFGAVLALVGEGPALMESLVVKIFATALAFSQVATAPETLKTRFDRSQDQELVAQLLHDG